jgi:hypothetical protein
MYYEYSWSTRQPGEADLWAPPPEHEILILFYIKQDLAGI